MNMWVLIFFKAIFGLIFVYISIYILESFFIKEIPVGILIRI